MKSLTQLMVICVMSVSAIAVADSAQTDTTGTWLLSKYDNNGDKIISLNEINTKRKQMHDAIDANSDGLVSFDEYQNVDAVKRASLLKRQFMNLDVNRDGHLSDAEYSAYQGNFDRLDLNGDGRITRSEMQSASTTKSKKLSSEKNTETKCLLWFCVRNTIN